MVADNRNDSDSALDSSIVTIDIAVKFGKKLAIEI